MSEVILVDKNVQELFKELQENYKGIEARRNAFSRALSPIVYADIIRHFEKESGPTGKWPAWSRSYKAAIAGTVHFRTINGAVIPIKGKDPEGVRGPGQKLQDRGNLRQNVRPNNFRGSAKGIEWYNPAKTKAGFPYAYAHNEGGSKLPQRQFMWLSKGALNKISKASLQFLLQGE